MLTRRMLLASGLAGLAAPALADPMADHQTALIAARAAQARAELLLREQGLARGSVAERLRILARDERFLYADDAAGRVRAVADMNARLGALRPRLAKAFGDLPIPAAEVRPADRNGYREAPFYYVDLRDLRARPSWTLPSVAFHETVPGHLLQLPFQKPTTPAWFSEAWATYAEQLAADLGAYDDDPLGEIGYLQWRLFRLGRVVADTGLSALGWSKDQAVATLRDLQGQSIAFITIEADVERIAANPGRVAAEGLAALAIHRDRPRDPARWPAYHRQILAG